jgi:hypothetical protein
LQREKQGSHWIFLFPLDYCQANLIGWLYNPLPIKPDDCCANKGTMDINGDRPFDRQGRVNLPVGWRLASSGTNPNPRRNAVTQVKA